MAAVLCPLVVLTFLIASATSSEIILPVAVTAHLTCTSDDYTLPVWILEGQVINAIPSDEREGLGVDLLTADVVGSSISSPIRISGSSAIHGSSLQCTIREEVVYNTTLLYQESLPAPTNLTAANVSGSIMIEWEPPILQDTELDHVRIHINPNILVYCVNITDTTNGTTLEVNVTQTSYGFKDYIQCHRYRFQISAWNAAGEGKRNILPYSPKDLTTLTSSEVTAVVPPQASHTRKRQQQETITIYFSVKMNISCQAKLPDAFDVRVTRPGLVTNRRFPYNRSEVVNFTITVTGVEDCTRLRVHIRARNSAGTSQFSEIPVDCRQARTTDPSTATTPATRSTGSITMSTDLLVQTDSMIYTAVGGAVGAVVIVTAVALLLLIILWKCKRTTKVKSSEENVYTKSPSRTPVYETAAVDIPTKSHTASPTESLASSTDLTHSNTPLVQQRKPPTETQTPEGNPKLVYARIDPAKHRRPQPPASDNQVQYAVIEYQDQL